MKFLPLLLITSLFLFFASEVKARVVINELGVTGSSDWFELYGYEDTDISGWYVDDGPSTSTNIYDFSQGSFIGPSTSKVLFIQLSGNKNDRFNDPGDTISLFKLGQENPVDSISYGSSGQICLPSYDGSIGRVANVQDYAPTNVWERFSLASKNMTNNNGTLDFCPTPEPTSTSTDTPTSTPVSTPTPTVAPTKTSTTAPTKSPIPRSIATSSPDSGELVLGIQNESPTPEASAEGGVEDKKKFPVFPVILIVTGFLCIAGAVFFYIKTNVKKVS